MNPEEMYLASIRFPDGYAKFRLQIPLHPIHAKVLNSLFDTNKPTKVSFRAGNSCGKTSIMAVTAICFAIEVLGARVVSTAAVYRQIKDQLMPNIRLHQSKFPNWRILENQIKIGEEWVYTGVVTEDASKFQGFHELGFDKSNPKPLLVIMDEAAGVHEKVYEQITRIAPDFLLIMGSPLGPEGIFYKVETDPSMSQMYKHFKMTQYDYLEENGWYLKRIDVENSIKEWGEDHPLIRSKVFAEFGSQIEGGIISLQELEKCYQYPPLFKEGIKHVALDFAAGGAENVIAFRNGNKTDIVKAWRDVDTMRACETFVEELEKLKYSQGITQSQVSGDVDGLGKGMIDRIKQLGWDISHFHGGGGKDDLMDPNYANKIAECWLEGIKSIKNCSVIIPNDNELKLQILSRKQKLTSNGRMRLESKQDMQARGIHSPDRADALFMAMSNPSPGNVQFHKQPTAKPRTYTGFF